MNSNQSYKLAARKSKASSTIVDVGNIRIGGDEVVMIAGPCAVESEEQIEVIARTISQLGVGLLRGGAYKPRTSPYSFQGLKEPGLKLMRNVADRYSLGVVTEVMDLSLLETVYPYADILQVGSRNMKNYHFLKELGKTRKPILLKRGMDATVEEWLLAAEYLLLGGNEQVILCERGIRTFDDSTRNTLDTVAIALAKELSHLPVLADPSQATGNRDLIKPASMSAVASGADGLMIEVHDHPEKALSDGPQSLYLDQFEEMLPDLARIVNAMGRTSNWKQEAEVLDI
ncbi:MAG: 3-deoxy-7-phosphoheptulonate synthase [Flavobacteriales bacterium]|nr:3-deoxy-7-phosphoheptulonate synthase [Bacteroidota bacterium]MCB9241647.1 3-deoxy-7-phosphoheptulonate synthase [Flavobacteriales bacterium]